MDDGFGKAGADEAGMDFGGLGLAKDDSKGNDGGFGDMGGDMDFGGLGLPEGTPKTKAAPKPAPKPKPPPAPKPAPAPKPKPAPPAPKPKPPAPAPKPAHHAAKPAAPKVAAVHKPVHHAAPVHKAAPHAAAPHHAAAKPAHPVHAHKAAAVAHAHKTAVVGSNAHMTQPACHKAQKRLCHVMDNKYAKWSAKFSKGKTELQHAANAMYKEALKLDKNKCTGAKYPEVGGYKWSKP